MRWTNQPLAPTIADTVESADEHHDSISKVTEKKISEACHHKMKKSLGNSEAFVSVRQQPD